MPKAAYNERKATVNTGTSEPPEGRQIYKGTISRKIYEANTLVEGFQIRLDQSAKENREDTRDPSVYKVGLVRMISEGAYLKDPGEKQRLRIDSRFVEPDVFNDNLLKLKPWGRGVGESGRVGNTTVLKKSIRECLSKGNASARRRDRALRPWANQKCAKEFEEKSQKGTCPVDAIVSQLGLGARHHNRGVLNFFSFDFLVVRLRFTSVANTATS